ncbi:hypothetical protein [Dysgonomonas sp. 511]|uniref:hypothetical protein n=1 Tax=Dysgonomonas sp. 511 TaxID=2302930 RepID=UPI0013D78A86|nr:hypothetical protein [Dysgonomonas sp. 511]NDV79785.1 hypothetical protein [Dysgonomonas sp. 511]
METHTIQRSEGGLPKNQLLGKVKELNENLGTNLQICDLVKGFEHLKGIKSKSEFKNVEDWLAILDKCSELQYTENKLLCLFSTISTSQLKEDFLKLLIRNLDYIYYYFLIEEIESLKKNVGKLDKISDILKNTARKYKYKDCNGNEIELHNIFFKDKEQKREKNLTEYLNNFRKGQYLTSNYSSSFCCIFRNCIKEINTADLNERLDPYNQLLSIVKNKEERETLDKIFKEKKLGLWEIGVERRRGSQYVTENNQWFQAIASSSGYINIGGEDSWAEIRKNKKPKGLTAMVYEIGHPSSLCALDGGYIKELDAEKLHDTWNEMPVCSEYWDLDKNNKTKTMIVIPLYLTHQLSNKSLLLTSSNVDVRIKFGFLSMEFTTSFSLKNKTSLQNIFLKFAKYIEDDLLGEG